MAVTSHATSKGKDNFSPAVDMSQPPYIRLQNVTKTFGDFLAVKDVSLDIYRGELFSLLGGSGCGKTTLLRMLAGFEQPTSGKIYIDGVDMSGIPPYDRPVNMMFQSYALFPHMTVEQNVAFGLKQMRLPRREIHERVGDILKMVQLGPFAKRKPHQLSGGQRQRVALARALVMQPKVLLLDEPLGALDKKLREATQFEIMNIQEQLGITFIVVTHDQEEAMILSTRMAVMNAGQIVQVGSPHDIYEAPSTRFVADFIGDINIFEAELKTVTAEGVVAHSTEAEAELHSTAQPASAQPGTKIWLAVRPEKIAINRTRPALPNVLPGQVKEIAYMGDISIFVVLLPNGHRIKATMPNVARKTKGLIGWDDQVFLSWDPENCILLER